MDKKYTFSVWWIKRDIRLYDNLALAEALKNSNYILPLFTFEPSIQGSDDYSHFHNNACISALNSLREKLIGLGSELWLDVREFEHVISEVSVLHKIDAIFSHEETGAHFTYQRDIRVKQWLHNQRIIWHEFPTNGVIRGLKSREHRNRIWHRRMYQSLVPLPKSVPVPPAVLASCRKQSRISLEFKDAPHTHAVSENEAWGDLKTFLTDRGHGYAGGISSPNTAFTAGSRLSSQLAWGTISLRAVLSKTNQRIRDCKQRTDKQTRQWNRSLRAFSSRLHWHDHFIQRLESEPSMEFEPLNSVFGALPYKNNEQFLERWFNGETGVPMVDACMRCLQETGFLNFRMRALVVSYACHVLHLSWRDIMYPLARLFQDYEPGIHISQLQMQAGVVGINTLRVYNPDKQMLEQDSDLTFVKSWVSELRNCENSLVFNYQTENISRYPAPIVNYHEESGKMKKAFYDLKRSVQGKIESKRVFLKHGSRRKRRVIQKKPDPQLQLL